KPLWCGWMNETFLFGSELKALRGHPRFRGEIRRDVLALFLRYGYVPAPHSIYEGISKLPPGTTLAVRLDRPGEEPEPVAYWSARGAVEAGAAEPFRGSEAEAIDALDRRVREAVRREMGGDVPLGAFLSGGIDSSTIVALMQAQAERPVKTFTIGFHEEGFDEAVHARAVARHLGTDHTELYVTPEQALEVIPRLPTIYDEPFADTSGIPVFLVSQLARRDVTVSLSGDGGDELFAGYAWYRRSASLWNRVKWMPRPLRRPAAGAVARAS